METIKLIILFLALAAVIFLTIKNLFFKSKQITIEITDCSNCVFKEKKEFDVNYNCKFQDIINKEDRNFKSLQEMKMYCPIEQGLEIIIKAK